MNRLRTLTDKERNYLETKQALEKIQENNRQKNIDIKYSIKEFKDGYYIEVVHD